VDALCACLLDARRSAEAQGRLDFTAEVEFAGTAGPVDVTARIWMGVAHAVGRIDFAGHFGINDSTLRRAMTIYEATGSTSDSCGAASRESTTSASSSRSRWRTSA
jgi:outer membrane protein assembly factor BamA